MIKIFDLHADIGYDMEIRKQQGAGRSFLGHQQKLLSGGIYYVAVACYFDGNETWEDMQEMILNAEEELSKSDVIFVNACPHPIDDNKLYTMISVEGMGGITSQAREKVKWMSDHGVKMASLTWNYQNALATGVKGDGVGGITSLGVEVLEAMKEYGMVLDVSHLNEASFWDAIRLFQGKLLASHSNVRCLCSNERNLTDQQIKAIARRGGLMGMNAAKQFISSQPLKQTAHQLALHAKYIKNLVGISHIGIGFDFMDYFDEVHDAMASDLPDASQAQNFIEALRGVGFEEREIIDIANRNALNFFHWNHKEN